MRTESGTLSAPASLGRRFRAALPAQAAQLARPFGVFVASRVVTVAAIAVAAFMNPDYGLKGAALRWDSIWYLDVARDGYPDAVPRIDGQTIQSRVAFFPLFPMAIRALSKLTGLSLEVAGLLLTTGLGALVAVLLWVFVRRLADAETADRATALLCFFPGSFVLSMVYAEALMLVLALGCLQALLSRRWLWAGAAAGLATATRPNAVALVACCLWEAIGAVRRGQWRALVAPALAPVGMVAFMAFLWARTGEAAAWLDVQSHGWGQGFDFGVASWQKLVDVLQDPLYDINKLVATAGLVFFLATGALLLRSKLPPVLVVYAVVIAVLAATQVVGARPRFALTAFPLFIALAMRARGLAFAAVLASCATLLGLYTILSAATLTATP